MSAYDTIWDYRAHSWGNDNGGHTASH